MTYKGARNYAERMFSLKTENFQDNVLRKGIYQSVSLKYIIYTLNVKSCQNKHNVDLLKKKKTGFTNLCKNFFLGSQI